ncbi:MAG: response regulator [Aquabacterium sp.]
MPSIRRIESVLVLDDHPQVGHWLAQAAAQAFPGVAVRRAASLREAMAALDEGLPDLALVDLDLPDGSGITLIEQLARSPQRPLSVVTTVFADDQHLFPALRAGAAGYLLKDGRIEDLVDALRGIAAGSPALSAPIARRLLGYFHEPDATRVSTLSPREQDVLRLLARGLTIAETGQALGLTSHTVASYAKTLYRKLDVTNRAEAVLEAGRLGLL